MDQTLNRVSCQRFELVLKETVRLENMFMSISCLNATFKCRLVSAIQVYFFLFYVGIYGGYVCWALSTAINVTDLHSILRLNQGLKFIF